MGNHPSKQNNFFLGFLKAFASRENDKIFQKKFWEKNRGLGQQYKYGNKEKVRADDF